MRFSGDLLGNLMKLHEFKSNHLQMIEAKLSSNVEILALEPITLFMEMEQCYLEYQQQLYPIDIQSTSTISASLAKDYIRQNNYFWTLSSQKNQELWISGFPVDNYLTLDIDIGVPESFCYFLLDESKIKDSQINLAIDWLNEEFLVDKQNSETLAFSAFYQNQDSDTIQLIGRKHLLEIKQIDDYWHITKLTKNRQNNNVRLVSMQGHIQFTDSSFAKKLDNITYKAALNEHTAQHGDYIETWKQYSHAQWDYAVQRANQIGFLRYSHYESLNKIGHWYIYINDMDKLKEFEDKWNKFDRKKDEQIQLGLEIPEWLDNKNEVHETGLKLDKTAWRAEIVHIDVNKKRILLKYSEKKDRKPPLDKDNSKGFLFLSIFSILVQRKRQQEALTRISTQQNPMFGLHSLLQGSSIGSFDVTKNFRKLKWKSAKTKNLFKGGRPTLKQQEAIELALNSSDLSIIIGPPGTGKTQVITALQQRIAEESNTSIQRSILLTSYQHDAVDNVVERSDVLGLAGLRIGGKTKSDDEEQNRLDTIAKWAMPIHDNIQQEIQNNSFILLYRALEQNCLKLRLGNTQQKTESKIEIQQILDCLQQDYKIFPSLDWKNWWQEFNTSSSQTASSFITHLYPLICSLRTTVNSFADDGIQQCRAVLAALELIQQQNLNVKLLQEDEKKLLHTFMQIDLNRLEQTDFSALVALKNTLIDRCLPDFRPQHLQSLLSEEHCQRLDQLLKEVSNLAKKSKTLGYLMILDKYNIGLSVTTGAIRDAIAHYTAVLAATCQQAAGNAMQNLKLINSESIIFENVIVDEAARATPLDLMIPMAMAKRRLVLVGDHRQLPHMLDDKVEKELSQQSEWNTIQNDMLKESLFQRLVENLTRLEKEELQPKRVIMLDTQFRMHPILGQFISQNFYENHGLPPIKAGRSETDFIHSISGYSTSVCAFKQILNDKQQRPNKGSGWHRPSEARWIAQEAKRILDEKPELSVGVISFYRGQVDTLFNEMSDAKIGLTIGDKIAEPYRVIETGKNKGDERLRIGTVDAFQGKEFDVVFVSLVRTLPESFQLDGLDDLKLDEKFTQVYGFLRVDNRLNVALSRQRSLLIVVGDSSLVRHHATLEAVPALPAFFALCGGEHGQIL